MGFDGRVAIVTGASRGIGFATAVLLAAEGAHVIGVGRTPLESSAEGVTHVLADVLDEATPALVVEKAISSYGRLDVLVNNAGTGRLREGYEQTLEADWRATWELLFLAPVRMTNAALPHLLAGDAGAIVNVSSRNARVPVPGVPDYSAAKAALNNYAKGLALQHASDGLRVVTVSPGPTSTALWLGPHGVAVQAAAMEGSDPATVVSNTERAIPAGRMVKPGEVADLIVYLASTRASMITGVDVLIDGGLTQTL
jgi:NAD(P)-dependent dehydrogenase (short-subunit alcohol dehydrogenase family)